MDKDEYPHADNTVDDDSPMQDVYNVGTAGHHASPSLIIRKVSSISEPKVKTGILGSSSNLVNAIVGAGIIGIPFAFKEAGFVAGIFLLVLVGIFTDKSLRMIISLATYHPKLVNRGVLTYEDLLSVPFGRAGRIFVLVTMFLTSFGPMVAYLIIIKDIVPDLLGLGDSFVERELVMFVTSLLIMLPLSLLRDISQLAFTSFLSVTADVVLVIVVGMYAPVSESVEAAGGFGQVLQENWINGGLFIGLGVLSTALACQQSSFLISGTLNNHTPTRWATVTGMSLVVAVILSLSLGIIGYLGFQDLTQGDVLKNFGQGSLVNVARALLAVTMFLTYPMESFVARHVIVQLLYNGSMENTTTGENGEIVPEKRYLFGLVGRRVMLTIVLYVAALIPALIFDDLGPVLSLTGSLGASSISYIAPGLAYIGLNGDDFLAWTSGRASSQTKQHNSSHDNGGEVELPVAGDATARMESAAPEAIDSHHQGKKPWWWYLLAMPIWVSLASAGDRGCQKFFSEMGRDGGQHPPHNSNGLDQGIVIGPRKSDYIYSIVFIVFGVVAAVAGLLSNIYVQMNKIYYTP